MVKLDLSKNPRPEYALAIFLDHKQNKLNPSSALSRFGRVFIVELEGAEGDLDREVDARLSDNHNRDCRLVSACLA